MLNQYPASPLNDSDRTRGRGAASRPPDRLNLLAWHWLVGFLSAALAIGIWPRGESDSHKVADVQPAAARSGSHQPDHWPKAGSLAHRPIESLRLGDRVLADNPQIRDEERTSELVDPATWRAARLAMLKADGSILDITLLRPVEWFLWEGVPFRDGKPVGGPGVVIEMDLAEMGAVGPATLLSVGPCPPLQPANPAYGGRDRLITGTYSHSSAVVINVHVTGEREPIGTTASHPFWSEDRQDFVPAGELRVGERLRSLGGGLTRVEAVGPRGPPERVYNLEVEGEHVYRVGDGGVLVHNTCREITLGRDPHFKALAEQTGGAHYRQWFDRGITRRTVERNFGRALHQATKRADRVHFALDDIDDVAAAVYAGRAGFRPGNFTNAELRHLWGNPDLLKKTTFYRGGKVVPSPF